MISTAIKVKVQLKSRLFLLELSEKQYEQLVEQLRSSSLVEIGPIIFATSEFVFMEKLK